ncbi:MAG: redoxin domain-containing protein [Bacteroides sp.]|nr:redoxin domain-containing protein [Bacteroides sp.]
MKYVKWIFVVLLISSLTSFISKDRPTGGLNIGDLAPDFSVRGTTDTPESLRLFRGKYVLISFWASYDASSRMQNVYLYHTLRSVAQPVEMISVSFDEFPSVFRETVRRDQLDASVCFNEKEGESSSLFKKYRLSRSYSNYLLNEKGVIVAKNITPDELANYLN